MCLILSGKVGSNIASEIGTMRVTQQIDALEIKMCIRDRYRRLCVCSCFQQQLFTDFLLCHGLSLHKLLQLLQVLVGIERNTLNDRCVTKHVFITEDTEGKRQTHYNIRTRV